eukprot:GHVT01033998.1.p1 GENE.GHVT01033998.1~~GHVT01033998.1.p1  ORF type:complete len:291 (+),score=75.00 GHVT01033998.1:1216-2088(+)
MHRSTPCSRMSATTATPQPIGNGLSPCAPTRGPLSCKQEGTSSAPAPPHCALTSAAPAAKPFWPGVAAPAQAPSTAVLQGAQAFLPNVVYPFCRAHAAGAYHVAISQLAVPVALFNTAAAPGAPSQLLVLHLAPCADSAGAAPTPAACPPQHLGGSAHPLQVAASTSTPPILPFQGAPAPSVSAEFLQRWHQQQPEQAAPPILQELGRQTASSSAAPLAAPSCVQTDHVKVRGVCYNPSDGTWSAQWKDTAGKRRKKCFTALHYGDENARQMAVAWRKNNHKKRPSGAPG